MQVFFICFLFVEVTIMSEKRYVDGKKFDWNLSHNEKTAVAKIVGAFSVCALIFSTVSTANAMLNICEGISFAGYHIGVFLALLVTVLISSGEISCIYLAVWKKSCWWLVPTLFCGYISVLGTIGFLEVTTQNAGIKKNEVSSIKKIITDKESEIARIKGRIAQYNKLINNGDAKHWTYTRLRQAEEKLSSGTEKLATLRSKRTAIEKKHGAIVSIGDNKGSKNMGIGIAIAVEIFLIGSTFVGIGLYQSGNTERLRYPAKQDSVTLEPSVDREKVFIDRKNGDNQYFVNQNNNPEKDRIVNQSNTSVDRKFGFEIGKNFSSSENKNEKKSFTGENKNLSLSENEKTPKKFERSNKNLSLGENKNFSLSENEIPKKVLTQLKKKYEKTGKSDATILYLWDSGLTNKSEIGRIAGHVLKGNRKKISPSYVHRVIKAERGQ
jgi:hypothetical protein